MRSNSLFNGLRLVFLLRIPLATLLLLVVLGPIALYSEARSLLSNLLDQGESWSNMFQVSLGAFLLAYAAVAAINLTLDDGNKRFGDSGIFPINKSWSLLTFLAGTASAATFLVFVIARTESHWWRSLTAALGGFAVTVVLILVAKLVQLALTDPATTPHPPYLIFPATLLRPFRGLFQRLYGWSNESLQRFKDLVNRLGQWPLEVLRWSGDGYLVDSAAPRGSLRLGAGHVMTLTLAVIAFLVYLLLGFGKRFITAPDPTVPALAYVLLFLNVACWFLSALTFFLDRFRFPVLWTMAALSLVTGLAPESDHFFRVETQGVSRGNLLQPAEFLKARIQAKPAGPKINLIFVASPGGGIQAGAWTAQVLAGLDTKFGNEFRSSVAAISSVSGGSLGSLLYAATFAGLVQPDELADHARRSALDEVAWGLTQPDFWRAVFPWVGERTRDRGWALEEKWTAVNHLGPKRLSLGESVAARLNTGGNDASYPEDDILLSDWAKLGPRMPALLFNSTLVERGQHVVFSTTKYPLAGDERGIVNFYDLYPDRGTSFDVRAVTAARLSASFPYVAPAARPDLELTMDKTFHFVDGGYYDNYGIDALIGWLRTALQDPALDSQVGDIFLLQIRHFKQPASPGGTQPGWLYQLSAPLNALLSMWNAAPVSRNRNELELFRKLFQGDNRRRMWSATVAYDAVQPECAQAPLSWKLSKREQRCISQVWDDQRNGVAVKCLDSYLRRPRDGEPGGSCGDLN